MNKKLISALIAISMSLPLTSQAAVSNQNEVKPSVAILDTAIDTSLPEFQGKIIEEVCLIQWNTCPNGQSYMVGKGAASMPTDLITKNGFDHGTQMASVFVSINPNVNIVFIKIIGNTPTGGRQNAGEPTVYNALNWVKDNASKYNIQAVTMSQGHHALGAGTDYCPKTPNTVNAVVSLKTIGIPVFFPSGNGRDYQRLDWPACINESVSVGYVDQQNEIAAGSNYDPARLDFFARGFWTVKGVGGVVRNISGSSSAVQVAAAQYMQIKAIVGDYSKTLSIMESSVVKTVGRQGTFNKLISVESALSLHRSGPVANPVPQVTPAPVVPLAPSAEQIAAEKKAKLIADSLKEIAAAEAQYQSEIKIAAEKLAAVKASWMAKING
jgi:hypothetical protein